MATQWFGPEPPNATGLWTEANRVGTPVESRCEICERFFKTGDFGYLMPLVEMTPEGPRARLIGYHVKCLVWSFGIEGVQDPRSPPS